MSAGLSSIVYADEADVLKIVGFATFFRSRTPVSSFPFSCGLVFVEEVAEEVSGFLFDVVHQAFVFEEAFSMELGDDFSEIKVLEVKTLKMLRHLADVDVAELFLKLGNDFLNVHDL